MDNKLFIINNADGVRPEGYQGVAVIRQALKESGLFMQSETLDSIMPDELPAGSIVGLSAYYQELDDFIKLGIDLQNRGHFVVLGGHSTYVPENNAKMLKNNYFSAINRGHAGPFVEFVKSAAGTELNKSQLLNYASIFGLATKSSPAVSKGKFPELNNFPLVEHSIANSGFLIVPPSRTCKNKCDYCAEHFSKVPDITDKVITALNKREELRPIFGLAFANPSFDEENIADIQKVLSGIKSRPKLAIYIDSCQIGDEEKLRLLDELNVTNMYIGLNAINNKSAEYIGRRENGKIRNNVRQEKKNIINFLSRKRNIEGKEAIAISIMYSKADEKQEIREILKFVAEVAASTWAYESKKISIQLVQSIPLPATKYHKLHKDDYSLNTYGDYLIGAPHNSKILGYSSQGEDFFRRIKTARMYLLEGNRQALHIGAKELRFAHDYVFEGNLPDLKKLDKVSKQIYSQDLKYIKNPDYVPKNGKILMFDTQKNE